MADGQNKRPSNTSRKARPGSGARERSGGREARSGGDTRGRSGGREGRFDDRSEGRARPSTEERKSRSTKPTGKRAERSSSGNRQSSDGKMRLNRAIASTGWCSRRHADELIEAGLVKVNGRVTRDFSVLVDPYKDRLSVEGRQLERKKKEYIALYKPAGILTTCNDERGRKTVLDILPETLQHLKPVGRLDRDSEGLLILTNDGDLAYRVTHPSHHVWKTYIAVVEGKISQQSLAKLRGGVELADGMTTPARVTDVSINLESSSFRIAIREGRNRQIRRMCIEIGHPVIRLVRVAIGRLQLRSMEPFDWKYLSKSEVEKCCED